MSVVVVEHARQQWAEGHRRLQSHASDRALYNRLYAQVELLLAALARRLGQTFTLAELAAAYRDTDRWATDVLAPGSGADHRATVEDAAFHLYARGAVDYSP